MFKARITPEMHYDDWAQQYDSDVNGWGYHAPDRVAARVKEFLINAPEPPRMLDVGIGTGLLSHKCKRVRQDAHITGLDISSKMLDICARRELADDLYRLDVARDPFPFEDEHFDLVIASGLMENIDDINNAMSEMARVTRPGGLMCFTYMPTTRHPYRESLAKKLRTGRTEDGKLVLGNLDLYRHNPENIKTMAKLYGIKSDKQESFVGYRTYVVMTVRYDLFAGQKIRGLQ